MAVRVYLVAKTNTLEFHPDGPADEAVADYLSGLVNASKTNLSKSAGSPGLNRAKADLLIKQAEQLEQKAHDGAYSLTGELRQYYEDKAREARRLAKELLGE